MRRSARLLLTAIISALMMGCTQWPESEFKLAPESNLPSWFAIPPQMTRAELTVKLDYYIDDRGRTATAELMDLNGHSLKKLEGHLKGLQPLQLSAQPSGFAPGYPSYELIEMNGITQVIEHRRMEPIFYVNGDPAVLKELTR
jgi:hypothetical protein